MGGLFDADSFDVRRRYPIGSLKELGSYGNLTFHQEPFFQNVLQLQGNIKLIRFMETNPGIYLRGLRSYYSGAGRLLLKRSEFLARSRNVKYLYFQTNNPQMESLGRSLGYELVGQDSVGNKYYLKRIRL